MTAGRIGGVIPRPSWRRLTWRQMVVGGVAVAVVLTIFAVVLVRVTTPRPADVVHNYLSALEHRDPERALRAAGVAAVPTGAEAAFLTASAIPTGWGFAITDVQSYDDTASVRVRLLEIGTRPEAAPADATAYQRTGGFELTRHSGRWRIDNPYAKLTVVQSPMRYLELGGVRQPIDPSRKEQGFLVFPGIYTPYSGQSGMVSGAPTRLVALPVDVGDGVAYQPRIRLTDRGQATLQQAADEFFDRCIADVADRASHAPACTLENQDIVYRSAGGYVDNGDLRTATYTLVRRPTVTMASQLVKAKDGSLAFWTQVAVAGEVRLAATGRNLDGRQLSFVMSCLIDRAWLVVTVQADGALLPQWQPSPLDRTTAGGPYITLDCHA